MFVKTMKITNTSDLISGAIVIGFTFLGLMLSRGIPWRSAAYPIVVLIGMAMLGALLMFNALRARDLGVRASIKTDKDIQTRQERRKKRILIIGLLLLITLYIASMKFLGFILATALFFFCTLFFLGMRSYITISLISIVTSFFIFFIFRTIMYISLPSGIFDPTELIYRYIVH